MGGQVLGGGVVILVAVVLWLVYLLPSLRARHQLSASERNAVRLNQALRVLAETSETPQEVTLELTARTVSAQHRVAKRAQGEREGLARRIQEEKERASLLEARAELARLRQDPARRRARARRATRLAVAALVAVGLGLAAWGVMELVGSGGGGMLVAAGAATSLLGLVALGRLARVGVRAARSVVSPAQRPAVSVQDVALAETVRDWTPRELPRPLASSSGSRAAAVLDAAAAREALRSAALDEAIRTRAAAAEPPSIDTARDERFARMGYVDDAEIEANVRRLLERRAAGQ